MIYYICGMHSGGTSITSLFLNECGIDMFIGDHRGPNKLGENTFFRSFSHRILNKNRYHRYEYKRFLRPYELKLSSSLEDNILSGMKKIKSLAVKKNIENWGFKAPINSLTIWNWSELLTFFGVKINIILIFRNPIEVLDSFKRRKSQRDLNYLKSDDNINFVWTNYMKSVLNFYHLNKDNRNFRFYFFNISDILNNPEKFKQILNLKSGNINNILDSNKFIKNKDENKDNTNSVYQELLNLSNI